MSRATYLTLLRVVISPIFLLVYLKHEALGISSVMTPYVLLGLWGISELSDAFDGYLARKFHEVTDFGKILDPMADSIARISAFLTFTLDPVRIPVILVLLFIYRDFIISTLRTVCALKGFALAARTSGKIKAIFQATVICMILLMMIPHSLGMLSTEALSYTATILVSVACLYTVLTGLEYLYVHAHYIRVMLVPGKESQ